jgi:hypothetical protein
MDEYDRIINSYDRTIKEMNKIVKVLFSLMMFTMLFALTMILLIINTYAH